MRRETGNHSENNEGKSSRKRRSGRFINILIGILLIVIVVSGFQLGRTLYRYYRGTQAYNSLQEEAGTAGGSGAGSTEGSASDADEGEMPAVHWKKLRQKYPDVKAWLWQKDTVINYPVAQAKDNQYYLHRLLNGEWEVKGTLFIDCRNRHPFTKDFLTVIYGHRMRDRSMFWHIADYRKKSYWKKHPTMELSTPKQNYRLEIFAACTIPAGSRKYQFDFSDAKAKKKYLRWIRRHADMYVKKVPVTASDRIVMLSTCTYEYQNARAVAFARLVPVK